ncbi:TPR-like protein [Ephemerocybe angulata]|uniref:TPR-like protein n=1 Tax=Ephemerocybe angulata TaxID=980116 RepID=A0A8H6H9T5_9AGAR|nr:TPR-like protein [Tulosesus angulatus]
MGQEHSFVAVGGPEESGLHMTNIVLERIGSSDDHKTSLNLKELLVFGIPGSEEGTCFGLSNASPGRWEMVGSIELLSGMDGIDFIVKCEDDEDIGIVHLDIANMGNGKIQPENGFSQNVDMFDAQAPLAISWELVEIPRDDAQVADGLALHLHDHGIERVRCFLQTGRLSEIAEGISALQEAVRLTHRDHPDLSERLHNLGVAFIRCFERTGQLSDLSEAISVQQREVGLMPEDHADLPEGLNDLGNSLTRRFERGGEFSDISEAISVRQTAVRLTPEGHADLPRFLNNLGNSLTRRFEHTGELSDISEAISVRQRALELTPAGHANLPGRLSNLGNSFSSRFEQTGELADISEAISIQQKAVVLTPEGRAELPSYLNNLGISLTCRFDQTNELSDISEAISVRQRAVRLAHEGHANLPRYLNNLGNSLTSRFERTGQLSDLSEAISANQRAVELTPEGDSDLPGYLTNLGASLRSRFERTGNLSDLSEAVSVHRRAVRLTPDGHANLPAHLSDLGISLDTRFERTGQLSDVSEAVSVQQKAVALTPEGHTNLPGRLNNLGISLTRRFDQTGELSDLSEAISVRQTAVGLTPEGHTDLPRYLNILGGLFSRRFERTGELSDLSEAISMQQSVVELTPGGHADVPAFLTNLGTSFDRRFERTGQLSDISEAVSVLQRVVHLSDHDHDSDLPSRLNNLGSAFFRRFERRKYFSDLSEAISAFQRAVELTPEGHADLPGYLTNLGTTLRSRFQGIGEVSDLSEAISVQQRALGLVSEGNADLPTHLHNLAISLANRFEQTEQLSDISEAISMLQRAVGLTPEGHANLPGHLSNLGGLLTERFKWTGDRSDISEAISVRQRALELTPEGHADLPRALNNLGISFNDRFISGGDHRDLDASISRHKAAATSTIGSPQIKLDAARDWAQLLIQHYPESPEIFPSFNTALRLVTLVAGLEQTVQGRYAQLQGMSGLALEAAAAACALDRADTAVEWLEQGRCLVWSQLKSLRTPLDNLKNHDSALAQRIADVSKRLESVGSSRGAPHMSMSLMEKMSLEDQACAHLNLAGQWDDLLKQARVIPGFESFLMPPPCSALLQHLPEPGPIIVINVEKRRCDALAVMTGVDEPLLIPLPHFSLVKANKYRANLTNQLLSRDLRVREGESATVPDGELQERGINPAWEEGGIEDVLRGLWTEVVKPILDGLGFSSKRADLTAEESLPRIWWCPTGPLSFLPLHAAGIYRGSNAESVLDYVVPSYTPTVTAIADRVANRFSVDTTTSGVFLTSQPNTPGVSSIPGTTREVQGIFEKAEENGVRALKLEGDELTVGACLEHMQNYSSIHLACHGSQNAAEPLQSRFLFHTGALDLAVILQSNLMNADLAFLSACQTSTGDEKISDEAAHLAAGMLAAGYRRVVATMWSIGDQPAQEVATNFYDYIFARREGASDTTFDGSLSAYALHHAVQKLRLRLEDSERSLLTWVPFVHFGY